MEFLAIEERLKLQGTFIDELLVSIGASTERS